MKTIKNRLKVGLKPLYEELFQHCNPYCIEWEAKFSYEKAIVPFVMQWGSDFPSNDNDGILFVGRATNDWYNPGRTVFDIFEGENIIFCREDQMIWVSKNSADNYNTNLSAFWRTIRKISSSCYPDEQDPLSFVAWSNLCKLAPNTGNPNDELYDLQLEDACKILQKEIEILSPKFVILMTGICWADGFISGLNNNEWPKDKVIEELTWGEHKATVFKINGRYIILTEHPQGKDESAHINCLESIIKKYRV